MGSRIQEIIGRLPAVVDGDPEGLDGVGRAGQRVKPERRASARSGWPPGGSPNRRQASCDPSARDGRTRRTPRRWVRCTLLHSRGSTGRSAPPLRATRSNRRRLPAPIGNLPSGSVRSALLWKLGPWESDSRNGVSGGFSSRVRAPKLSVQCCVDVRALKCFAESLLNRYSGSRMIGPEGRGQALEPGLRQLRDARAPGF